MRRMEVWTQITSSSCPHTEVGPMNIKYLVCFSSKYKSWYFSEIKSIVEQICLYLSASSGVTSEYKPDIQRSFWSHFWSAASSWYIKFIHLSSSYQVLFTCDRHMRILNKDPLTTWFSKGGTWPATYGLSSLNLLAQKQVMFLNWLSLTSAFPLNLSKPPSPLFLQIFPIDFSSRETLWPSQLPPWQRHSFFSVLSVAYLL